MARMCAPVCLDTQTWMHLCDWIPYISSIEDVCSYISASYA